MGCFAGTSPSSPGRRALKLEHEVQSSTFQATSKELSPNWPRTLLGYGPHEWMRNVCSNLLSLVSFGNLSVLCPVLLAVLHVSSRIARGSESDGNVNGCARWDFSATSVLGVLSEGR